jgi:hypothetical protein
MKTEQQPTSGRTRRRAWAVLANPHQGRRGVFGDNAPSLFDASSLKNCKNPSLLRPQFTRILGPSQTAGLPSSAQSIVNLGMLPGDTRCAASARSKFKKTGGWPRSPRPGRRPCSFLWGGGRGRGSLRPTRAENRLRRLLSQVHHRDQTERGRAVLRRADLVPCCHDDGTIRTR